VTRRLLLSYVSLTVLVLVLLEVPLGITFANAERRHLENDVQHDAFALALRGEEIVETVQDTGAVSPDDLRSLARLANEYEREQGGRVVFLDQHGVVLADSDPPELSSDENPIGRDFSSRPEIARALRGLEATGDRHSDTLGFDVLFVAVPIASGGVVHGAVRVTYPLSFVDDRIRDNWLVLAAVAGVILLIVPAVSLMLARSIAQPLAALEAGAEALGQGNLDTRVPVPNRPQELESLARSFNTTAAQLEQLVDSQQAFVADASHQLRTPLAALRLRLENLQREVTPEGRDDLYGAIEEVSRLSLLVDGLLELARVESHASSLQAIDLDRLLEDRRDAWSALAEERDVTIAVSPSGEHALATPGRLEQVLDNLLNNAIEVAPPGSSIDLTSERHGTHVCVRVADAGPGMSD
jgi:signal transduction histidine kinase